jgi:hypothetical protein
MVTHDLAIWLQIMAGFIKRLINRVMVAGGAKIDGLIKSDFFLTVNPVRLYRLILAPAAAVHYHVERTVYIKGEGQIPQWFSINLATLFRTATAGYTLSLLKLEYFSHFAL